MPTRKPSSRRRTCFPRIVLLITCVVFLKLISHSWMLMRKVVVVDNTQSHYDGRIRPIQHSHSKASFQRDNIKYAYFIGHDRFGGRTNNELLAVLRALDLLFDRHGQGNNNSNAILVICGWAQDMLKGFFFNETNLQDWALKLEQVTPYIIATDRLGSLHRIPLLLKNFTGENYFRYHSNPQHDTLSKNEILKQRRNLILGPLFRNPSAEKMQGYHMLKQHLAGMAAANDKLLPDTYLAVHSRWLEGTCRQRVGNLLPHDECTMKPGYVKRILEKMDMLGRVAVVVITDMQNEQVIELLKNDTEIGNHVIVPALDIKGWSNDAHPATDMMVAIHGHAFVGTRVSSMALMIGLARNAIGKDPLTNFVYVDKDLNVCQECLYYCNAKRTSLCGGG